MKKIVKNYGSKNEAITISDSRFNCTYKHVLIAFENSAIKAYRPLKSIGHTSLLTRIPPSPKEGFVPVFKCYALLVGGLYAVHDS